MYHRRDGRRADARDPSFHSRALGRAEIAGLLFRRLRSLRLHQNIYRTLKVGSGNAAHVNRFLCVPQARFLGVTPQDIIDFGLEDATHPLSPTDIKRAQDALHNDPFIKAHPEWTAAIKQLLAMGVRAEQQALAKWGLNYVISEYLPKKLAEAGAFLP